MLVKLARSVFVLAVVLSPLMLAGSAGAVIDNGGGPSVKGNPGKVCLARWRACYKHCEGWYSGSSGKINDCKTRTCDYQLAACAGWVP